MSQVNLNEVRDRVFENQLSGVDVPSTQSRSVFVSREGSISLQPNGQRMSQIPMKPFASSK